MTQPTPTGALAPMSYTATFDNPNLSMSVRKKDCSTKYNRFLDFAVGIMFPVKSDNTIEMSPIQFMKVMDIIVMELQSMINPEKEPSRHTSSTRYHHNDYMSVLNAREVDHA